MAEGSLHSTQMNMQTCEKQIFQVEVNLSGVKCLLYRVQSPMPTQSYPERLVPGREAESLGLVGQSVRPRHRAPGTGKRLCLKN